MVKFVKEARVISQLHHPHIVSIFDVFKENNTAYYVMDYIEGYSLQDIVKKEGALSESRALNYIRQIAGALEYMHGKNLLHLDVKPANIMVDNTGNAILIDFGLSKQYDMEGSQTSTTPVGISHGYAPIEQYWQNGVRSFSPQTDVYSLGATLYKLLSGQTPPQPGDILDDGLLELPSSISEVTRKAVRQAMQMRKVDRPHSIIDFIEIFSNANNKGTKTVPPHSNKETVEAKEETVIIGEEKTSESISPKTFRVEDVKKGKDNEESKRIYVVWALLLLIPFVFFLIRNSSSVEAPKDNSTVKLTDSVAVEKYKPTYQSVNLGLSVEWASFNIGADSPEDYGGLFCWGDPTGQLTKQSKRSFKNISGTQLDIATIQWGSDWRLPTKTEMEELIKKCTWTFITIGNVSGYKVIGSNGNSIFLPAAGSINSGENNICERNVIGNYWTDNWYADYQGARYLCFYNGKKYISCYNPSYRFSIRPVKGAISNNISDDYRRKNLQKVKPKDSLSSQVASTKYPKETIKENTDSELIPTIEDEDIYVNSVDDVYEVVEEMPEYPTGMAGLMTFIGQNLQYPRTAQEKGVQGRVVVSFVVNQDGTPVDFKIVHGVDEDLDKEAIRVLKLMSKWKPGKQKDKPVRVKYTLPIGFRLE